VPIAYGGEWQQADLGFLASGTSGPAASTIVALLPAGKPARRTDSQTTFLYVRSMACLQSMAGSESIWRIKSGLSHGGYPVWCQPIQRRCLGQSFDVRSGLERRSATRKNVQSGSLHGKMGAELGDPQLSLG